MRNHLTVSKKKMTLGSFTNVIKKMCLLIINLIYFYKKIFGIK